MTSSPETFGEEIIDDSNIWYFTKNLSNTNIVSVDKTQKTKLYIHSQASILLTKNVTLH